MVGSTALSTRFDPEDLRDLIGTYQRAVADTVARFDGFVAKYMGDGVLIYFGYPQAHEDDAERAVRAGLAVIEACSQVPAPDDLRVRLGVARRPTNAQDCLTAAIRPYKLETVPMGGKSPFVQPSGTGSGEP